MKSVYAHVALQFLLIVVGLFMSQSLATIAVSEENE